MIRESDIDQALSKIEKGLRKYCWIQEQILGCDVRTDKIFQNNYNGFYRVRRDAHWQKHYYEIMEMEKNRKYGFGQVLSELKRRTNRIEASFASKLVATLNPNQPVIDKFILDNFNLHLPYQYEENRVSKTVEIYDQLCSKYDELMGCSVARIICEKFTKTYPWAATTDLKKVDFILWQTRKTKPLQRISYCAPLSRPVKRKADIEQKRIDILMTHGGHRAKRFDWVFRNDFVIIKNENGRQEEYSIAEILAVLSWLTDRFGVAWFPLANNVEKLGRNEETDGLGVSILRQYPGNIIHAQGSSYLGVVLEYAGILEWNNKHRGIEWRIICQTRTLDELRKVIDKKTA